jgi:translocation and assembly module TamB
MDVRVRIPESLVVRGQALRPGQSPISLGAVNVTLGGDLRITKQADRDYRLLGQISTVRGTYNFQGRRFDILRDGTVRFGGQATIDPTLDIVANRVISGVEARVNVRGTLSQPELTLSSRPPLDEADVLSLIIFNAPSNELGQGQQLSLAQRAGEMATGFAAGKIADSIGRALGLDVFEISTTPESGTGQGATLILGQQIGQNLFVKVKQGVGADNVSQFVLDYQISNFVRLETTMSQGGTTTQSLLRRTERGGVDLIFFFSY